MAESGTIAKAYVQILPSAKGIGDSLEAAMNGEVQKAGKSIGDNFAKSFGGSLSKLGSSMTKYVSLPLAGVATAGVGAATNFESSFAKLTTIVQASGDASEETLASMRDQIMQLSNETGVSADEISESAYQAISAGQDSEDAIKFVNQALKLSKAGFTNTATATDTLTTALNAYGLSADSAAHVSDVLLTTQNLGKTTVDELGASMGKVIPTAAAYGVNMEQLSAAYVTTTKNGIATAESGTYINSMLNELGKSGTKASTVLLEKTGKSFKELMDSGMSLSDVLAILQESADESGLSIMDMFGSAEAGKAAATMTQHANDFTDALTEMGESAGATQTAFETMEDTAAVQFEKLKTTALNALIELGATILPTLVPIIEQLASGIQNFSDWFANLSPGMQDFILKLGLAAIAAGPMLQVGGKMISTFGNVSGLLGGLTGKFGGLGSAASTAATPLSSTGGILSKLSANATGLLAFGGAVLMVGGGFFLLAKGAVEIANAGPLAIAAMALMVGSIALFAAGAAALGTALTAAAPGLIAFGASITLIGAGVLLAGLGFKSLGSVLPTVAVFGGQAALAILKLSGAMTAMTAAVALASPALLLIAASGLTASAGLLVFGGSATLSAAGIGLAALAVKALNTPMKLVAKNAKEASASLREIKTTVNIVEAGSKALKTEFSSMLTGIVSGLKDKAPDAQAAGTSFSNAYVSGVTTGLNTLPARINASMASSLAIIKLAMTTMTASVASGIKSMQGMMAATKFRFGGVEPINMKSVTSSVQAQLKTLQRMFLSAKFSLNQSIALPHFSMSGSFNAKTKSVPYVNVSWYSKAMDQAMVLDGATIFGAAGGNLLGAGESGAEVIAGEQHLLGLMRDVVSAETDENGTEDLRHELAEIKAQLAQYLPALSRMQMVLDTGTLVGEITAPMDASLGQRSIRKGRENL